MVVHCYECGNAVSDRAANCPVCGADMMLPVSEEDKERLARQKVRRSGFFVVSSCLFLVVSLLLSGSLLNSANRVKANLRNDRLHLHVAPPPACQTSADTNPDGTTTRLVDDTSPDMLRANGEIASATLLMIGCGAVGVVLLLWSVRQYRWHAYRYRKYFSHWRR